MTNHPAKTSGAGAIPQSNRIVCNHEDCPVCLDSVPRAHKHLFESEMLFDVLMEGFDPDALEIKLHHLKLGHFEIVGNKKTDAVFCFGNKQKHGSDFRQMNQTLGYLEPFLFGSSDGFVFPLCLGQATERNLSFSDFDDSVSFDSGKEYPSGLPNEIDN